MRWAEGLGPSPARWIKMYGFTPLLRCANSLAAMSLLCGLAACDAPAPEGAKALRRDAVEPPFSGVRPPSFIGAWTTASDACARPWIINQRRLVSPEGVVCRFEDVRAEAEGWRVAARCALEGDALEELYFETGATSQRRLTLQGGPFPVHRLILCGSELARP